MKKGIKMKKRLVFKKWCDTLVQILLILSVILIISSIDSEWSIEYLLFLNINIIIMCISGILLKKYSKSIDK